jgi:GAF domain-containing protein
LCEAQDAFIIRVAGDVLQIVAHSGKIPTEEMGTSFPILPGYAAGTAVLTRQVVHVRDLAGKAGAEFPETQSLQGPRGVRTVLFVPLLRDGAAIGVISMRRREVRPFSAKQIELVRTFADQAVIALENTRLFGDQQLSHRFTAGAGRCREKRGAALQCQRRDGCSCRAGWP